jgi:hypothetical protein
MSAPNNEPERAFPHHETTSRGEPYHDHLGMTLRQYFAGQANASLIIALSTTRHEQGYSDEAMIHEAARLSILSADTMLALLAAKGGRK